MREGGARERREREEGERGGRGERRERVREKGRRRRAQEKGELRRRFALRLCFIRFREHVSACVT